MFFLLLKAASASASKRAARDRAEVYSALRGIEDTTTVSREELVAAARAAAAEKGQLVRQAKLAVDTCVGLQVASMETFF